MLYMIGGGLLLYNILKPTLKMLDNLKTNLANNHSVQSVLNELNRPSFLHSLNKTHLQELANIVEGKNQIQLHPKVCTALYSIIVMKGLTTYNTKLAIDLLTKYYRQLQPSTTPQSNESQPPVPDSTQTRKVIANLLIRIPTFSNYKLIIKDIHPNLIPLSLILRHRPHMIKQCPNLYKDYLLKQYKYVWHRLVEEDQDSYPLAQDLTVVRLGLQRLAELTNLVEIHNQFRQLERLIKFIGDRIGDTQKQEINIEKFCQQLEGILSFTTQASTQQVLLPFEVLSTRNIKIRLIKSSCTQILRRTVLKFGYSLWRKFSWLTSLVRDLSTRFYDETSILPSYLISLSQALLQVFGIGFYNFDKLVKDEEPYCLAVLISALCYNNYDSNNKSEMALLNHQHTKNRRKNDIHISIYNTTIVDSIYEFYLKTTTEYDRQLLLSKILAFLSLFYASKRRAALDYSHSAEILSTLATSKNPISRKNSDLVLDIKKKVLFRGFQYIGDHLEQFCQDTFAAHIMKKSKKTLLVHRCLQVLIEPSKNSFDSSLMNKQKNKSKQSQFRRTNSFDIEFEGWGHNKSEQKGEKSQMFYSIKQCSVLDQGVKDQKQKPEEQNQFILTPEF